jgi:hypothetical protein
LIQAHAALKEAEAVIVSVRALLALDEAEGDTTNWEGALKNAEDCRNSLDTHHVRIAFPPMLYCHIRVISITTLSLT